MDSAFSFEVDAAHEARLIVRQLEGREAMNEPYEFVVSVLSAELDRRLDHALLGRSARLTIRPGDGDRLLHGVVGEIETAGVVRHEHHDYAHYRIRFVPRLWLLSQRKSSRVFQDVTVPDVIASVLEQAGVPCHLVLRREHAPRKLCVQYDETDLEFVTRLLAEIGGFYWFEQIPLRDPVGSAMGALFSEATEALGDEAARHLEGAASAGLDALLSAAGLDRFVVPIGDVVLIGDDPSAYTRGLGLPSSLLELAMGLVNKLGGALNIDLGPIAQPIASEIVSHVSSELGAATERTVLPFRPPADGMVGDASRRVVHDFVRRDAVRPAWASFRDVDERRPRTPVSFDRRASLFGRSPSDPTSPEAIVGLVRDLADSPSPDAAAATLGEHAAAFGSAMLPAAAKALVRRPLEVFGHHTSHPRPEWAYYQQEPARMLGSHRRDASVASGASPFHHLRAGRPFELADHPLEWFNAEYVPIEIEHRGRAFDAAHQADGHATVYENTFRCVPANVAWVPQRERRAASRGCVTATVVDRSDEIHTDEFAMIKVRFHWDRRSKSSDTTCWIRCMQASAGTGFGTQFIPRAGMEVVVDFEDGDPDRPIVLGALYNAVNPPPFALPEEKTRSGIRTRTTPNGSSGNELSFEDGAGRQQVFLRAERDWDSLVLNDRSVDVRRDDRVQVTHDQTTIVGGVQQTRVARGRSASIEQRDETEVDGTSSLTVRGSRTEHVFEQDRLEVDGVRHEEIRGARTVSVGSYSSRTAGSHTEMVGSGERPGTRTVRVEGTNLTSASDANEVESEGRVVLRSGSSFVRVARDRIEICSKEIFLKSGDTKILLNANNLHLSTKGTLQGYGEEAVKMQSSGSGLELTQRATLDGGQVALEQGRARSAGGRSDGRPPTIIELVDDRQRPIPNRQYRVVKGDGSEQWGVLDAEGKATLDLEESAQIFFPGLRDVQG